MERDEWPSNNGGDISLGGERRELSNYSAIFLQPQELADALCGCSKAPIAFVPKKSTRTACSSACAPAGDEVVTTKSGHQTYGMDWFFSSLAQRPVKGLAFFALSLVSLEQRQSYPLRIEQVIRPVPEAKAAPPKSSSGTFG